MYSLELLRAIDFVNKRYPKADLEYKNKMIRILVNKNNKDKDEE